jgi:hypothetical protein
MIGLKSILAKKILDAKCGTTPKFVYYSFNPEAPQIYSYKFIFIGSASILSQYKVIQKQPLKK